MSHIVHSHGSSNSFLKADLFPILVSAMVTHVYSKLGPDKKEQLAALLTLNQSASPVESPLPRTSKPVNLALHNIYY